jgi:Domain of unknown function (DUF4157)
VRTFAEGQNQPHRPASSVPALSNIATSRSNHRTHSIPLLQRTIADRSARQSPQVDDEEAREVSAITSTHFAHDFSRMPVHAPSPLSARPKLAVDTPGDSHEQEADRVSEQVMRMPESRLRLACACGGASASPQTGKAGHGHERLQMKRVGPGVQGPSEAPSGAHEVLRSPGRPLDVPTRAFMEPRFGHDFSRVRIHADAEAAQTARQLHASAYTSGDHIVFAEGRFAPSTPGGARLLAHELVHVIQGAGQGAVLRRQPDPNNLQADEARLRVRIVDTLETTKSSAIDAMASAIERGDRAYLRRLGLSPRQINHLLNHTAQFAMTFGTAAELAVEQAVRADPFLSQYVKRGPVGRVPVGVGKPDWRIETPSSSIAVDLMTPDQVKEKLGMWRRQSTRGKPKWYIEKGLNITYDRPPVPGAPAAPGTPIPESAQPATRASGFRTAARLVAREAPNLLVQAAVMLLFPPGVNVHNDRAGELSQKKLGPAVEAAVAKQERVFDKLQADEPFKSIYANVTARLDYSVAAGRGGDLELYLKDITFLEMQITNDDIFRDDPRFSLAGSTNVTKQITYSILLHEPENVRLDREWARKQAEYEECVQRLGTGRVPHPAGVDVEPVNPESGPCIPPRMEPMEGP